MQLRPAGSTRKDVAAMNWKKLIAPLLGYALLCAVYSFRTGDFLGLGLVWNIGLALLPLPVFRLAQRQKNMAAKWALLLVWVLLLPNTFYMITDLIHVPSNMEWVGYTQDGRAAVMHSPYVRDWTLMLLLGMGAFMAVMLGCRALSAFEKSLPESVGPAGRQASIAVLSFLCGVGIYIGRFLRFNSWDIRAPIYLLRVFWESLDTLAVLFIVLMSYSIFLLYYFYRRFCA